MADLTPAATLRAAAKVLRDTAADASSELWDDLFPDSRAPHIKATNAWVRLMYPGLAEPLAAWLEGVAKDIDGHDPDGGCECTKSDSYHRAMDFAAAILGRTS